MSQPSDEVRVVAPRGLGSALTRYRVMAFVTGVVLATMTVALVAVHVAYPDETARPGWYAIGWMAHGWLYVMYVVVGLDLVFRLKWHLGRAFAILIAGTIPGMSFVAERYVTHRVEPLVQAAGSDGDRTAATQPADR